MVAHGLTSVRSRSVPPISVARLVLWRERIVVIRSIAVRGRATTAGTAGSGYLEAIVEEAGHQCSLSTTGEADYRELVHVDEWHCLIVSIHHCVRSAIRQQVLHSIHRATGTA